jgi:DNA-binding NtrC family response regulator
MNSHRLMAIDDENIVGKMIKTVFEQDDYTVETFLNPKEAMTRLKEEKFDVVITDLKMRDMDGMEVLKNIKKNHPETKVIMITAFASLDAAVEAFRRHADDFFAKPVKISDLKACVQKLLGENPS